MIKLSHVSKQYGKKNNIFMVLDDVSLEIPSGKPVAIVGKSGSGKSTLMHVMSGLDHIDSGDVIIDGRSLTDLKQKDIDHFRATKMSFIFQSFFVQGNETCFDNVSLPLEIANVPRGERKSKVIKALRAVELDGKVKSKAKDLSGGEKQRLAIARAIVNQPVILFADEPTGNLDSATSKVVEDLLFNYCKQHGATLIIVTHDHDLAAMCEKQIHIKDGRLTK